MTSAYPPPRRQTTTLPLFLAGAAFILTAWLVADRLGLFNPGPRGEPRAITPRGDLSDYEKDIIKIFEENAPSVVHITTESLVQSYWGMRKYVEGTGSGFVWDASGTVVTNYHVIAGHEREAVKAVVGGEKYDAVLVNASPNHDIAVLRILGAPGDLRPIPVGTSADLKVGQMVAAIGNPFGLDQTLSTGVVSALNRTITTGEQGQTTLYDVIQIDAAINPGNSGGPLLDSAGRLIGMNTAIYSPSGASAGIGFAIPVDTINQVAADLIAGRPVEPLLGIEGGPLESPPGHGYRGGVIVAAVTQNMGAAEAGIIPFIYDDRGVKQSGDVIVEVDGHPVVSTLDIRKALQAHRRGEAVTVKVIRGLPGRSDLREFTVQLR